MINNLEVYNKIVKITISSFNIKLKRVQIIRKIEIIYYFHSDILTIPYYCNQEYIFVFRFIDTISKLKKFIY